MPKQYVNQSPVPGLNTRDRMLAEKLAFTADEQRANAAQEQALYQSNLEQIDEQLRVLKDPALRKLMMEERAKVMAQRSPVPEGIPQGQTSAMRQGMFGSEVRQPQPVQATPSTSFAAQQRDPLQQYVLDHMDKVNEQKMAPWERFYSRPDVRGLSYEQFQKLRQMLEERDLGKQIQRTQQQKVWM